MKQYIFLLRVNPTTLTDELVRTLGVKWKSLIARWSAEGIFVTNYRFNEAGASISGVGEGDVLNAYFSENSLALMGAVILFAKDLRDATTISKSFPTLEVGGSVEIREIQTNTIAK